MSTTEFGKLTPEQRKAFEPPVDAWVKPAEKPSIGADWPQYRSHKVVRAVEIRRMTPCDGLPGGEGQFDVVVRMAGADGRPMIQGVRVGADVVAGRYNATEGDFLVRYEPDGYLSVSPRDKFLDGYAKMAVVDDDLLGTESPIIFDAAGNPLFDIPARTQAAPIEIAMEAREIARELDARDGFMDFGRALYFLKEGRKVARSGWNGKGMWLMLVPEALAEAVSFQYAALKPAPWIGMRTADEKFVPWLASQTDMLARDWTVVP